MLKQSIKNFLLYIAFPVGIILFFSYFYFFTFAHICQYKHSSFDETNFGTILFFADPQIEGGDRVISQGIYGLINLIFNDIYQKWVYLNMVAVFKPEVIVVLGDLFSRQNLINEEFYLRLERYNSIFTIPKDIKHFINIVGNHDIGYGFTGNLEGVRRFEANFPPNKVNGEFIHANHHFIYYNTQQIDSSKEQQLYNETTEFLHVTAEEIRKRRVRMLDLENIDSPENIQRFNEEKERSIYKNHTFTEEEEQILEKAPIVILQHIPLYKPKGTCADSPLHIKSHRGYIIEQAMLSQDWSDYVLNAFSPIAIFNGHDHNGCFYEHPNHIHTKEYTVRSLMGDFGGYSAVFEIKPSAKNNDDKKREKNIYFDTDYNYNVFSCSFVPTWFVVTILITTGFYITIVPFCCIFDICCLRKKQKLQKQKLKKQ
eukprot:TRINITY_DN839_c5_g1_i1.p1 TRINITY_DN839_c5_g1~~TRINITY_DN839_c5_g1_i1.p1  ORF type:complete len:427 (-),score=67.47 TRINITY_DN839_c5_g1_i1:4-1284(-)